MTSFASRRRSMLVLGFAMLASAPAGAVVIDFETVPPLPQGPSLFATAGPMQTIAVPGVASVSGGVVLGLPTFTPAIDFATVPNLYGTANSPSGQAVGHPSLVPTITIDVDPALAATTVEGLVINGLIRVDTFTVRAFGPNGLLDTVVLDNVPDNASLGFRTFSFSAEPITQVTITPSLASGEWDYFIDSIAVNEPIPFCPGSPKEGCIAAALGQLALDERKAGKEKLALLLARLETSTTLSDFGAAGLATRYDVCLYDGAGTLVRNLIVARVGASCGKRDKPCWKEKSSKGFRYVDPDGEADGVRQITATSGGEGKGKLLIVAGNNAKKGQTALPTGLTAALQGATSATVQVNALGGACFEAALSVQKADGRQFKAKR